MKNFASSWLFTRIVNLSLRVNRVSVSAHTDGNCGIVGCYSMTLATADLSTVKI